jgi:cytoskeleton protein RodZ
MNEVEKNIWETLRTSRERLGLSINDVSVATKINPRILKALEAGERDGLPPKSFTRGFIRSYAAYLKIDAQPILDAYSTEVGVPSEKINDESAGRNASTGYSNDNDAPAMEVPVSAGAKESQTRKAFAGTNSTTASKAALIGGIFVLIGVVVGVKNVVDKYAQERVIEPTTISTETAVTATAPATDVEAPAAEAAVPKIEESATTKEENIAPAITTTPEPATAAATATPIEPAKTEPTKVEVAKIEPPKVEAPKVEVTKAEPAKVEAQKAEPPKADAPKPEVAKKEPVKAEAPKVGTPQEVILEALDKVEINIRIDGESSKKLTLNPESVHTIKAKSSIEIEVSDGGMVNVIHNGRERGVPGDLGKSAKLKYP